jgi:hypothetical protein
MTGVLTVLNEDKLRRQLEQSNKRNPELLYEGSTQPDEDPADYVRVEPIKAVRLA